MKDTRMIFNICVLTIFYFSCVLILHSCTYSITMVGTQGEATDVVDESATNAPSTKVDPTLTIPVKAI